ncbi:hypothetical protein INR76_09185 [Marixanthomonas sp. SCSIO 43207]|uniref:TlpA family protein disulfide reductase n=1 Tax=Marixanthomonas sp. SCSIO 43207 TaxID=2779360 RepID=UPI001CA7D3B0|nr:peroxiredoxin family protein [Marixanthomonas sp. SCSIO 43207]UAB80289.1 hypothetical protein INR76_09185 [Marixanthomonas sp. SCSIO 43207]
MKAKLLLLLLLITVLACNDTNDTSSKATWLSGEIVNPKSDFVYITQNNKILDTVKLNSNNYFSYQIKDAKKGIYFFNHNEYQAVYVEPGDSILLRVNTMEFDESLSFSGRGGNQNNLLMKFFLLNEDEAPLLAKYNQLPPKEYETKIDSLKKGWEAIYKNYLDRNNPSDTFKKVAQANIEYIYNMRKELYTSAHLSIYEENEYPKGFFDYRKSLNYGSELLRTFYPYYRFLNYYTDNLAHNKIEGSKRFNRTSFSHNLEKIKILDSIITNDSLKNDLLKYNVRRYLLNAKNAEEEKQIVEVFNSLNTNPNHKAKINKLASATIKLTPNHTIPDLILVTTDNTLKNLQGIITKPSVIYFWSMKSNKHYKNVHQKVAELKSKYPEYNYIGINTDTHFKKWRNIVNQLGYNPANEYQFEDIDEAEKKLVLNSVHKTLIVDKNGKILEGNTNLLDQNIEELLLGYLNK